MRRTKTGSRAVVSFLFFALAVALCQAQENERQGERDRPRDGTSSDRSPTPREVRGYRVERAEVRLRRARNANATDANENGLIRLGTPRVASLTPLGVWLEVPVTIAAVEGRGEVEMLVFEDVRVDGTPVTVEEYAHPFRLPNDGPLTLPHPARIYMSITGALLGATSSALRETWPVTGRVYVCGRFRRFLFTFRRAVPIELNLSVANPLNNQSAPPRNGQNRLR